MVWTEMIPAEGLVRNWKKNERYLRSCPEERPLAVQLFGVRPEVLAEAAARAEDYGADLIDINMGCPVRKVVGGGAGAALLKDLGRLESILRAVRRAIRIPLTIKIRSGWDEKNKNFLTVGKIAEACGADALILHGRTRSQNYGTPANWDDIAKAKELLAIPVIGNGDLTSPEAIVKFFAQTGCSGAMIARGSLGNPWIFRMALEQLQGNRPIPPTLEEKEAIILRHLEMMIEDRGEHRTLKEFRKHLIWYTRGLRGAVDFRSQIPTWGTITEMKEAIQGFFHRARESTGHDAVRV